MFDFAVLSKYLPLIQQLIDLLQKAQETHAATIASNDKVLESNAKLAAQIEAAQVDRNFVEKEYSRG